MEESDMSRRKTEHGRLRNGWRSAPDVYVVQLRDDAMQWCHVNCPTVLQRVALLLSE